MRGLHSCPISGGFVPELNMHRTLQALAVAALLAGCSEPAAKPVAPKLAVADARVTLSPVPGRPAAAYLTLTGGAADDRLIALGSPQVATIELHEGGMRNGMMTMARVTGINVPAGGPAELAPGGDHAMLFGVDPAIRPGGTLPLTLSFASGARLETRATVRGAGDAEIDAH
jgi:copper(I)-binding protein